MEFLEEMEYVGDIPEGWKWVKLGDIADIKMGQSPESKYYNDKGIGLPFLQGSKTFGYKYPEVEIYCSNPIKVAKKGEILISVRAPVGDINIASQDICIGRGIASINSLFNQNEFLFYYLKHSKNDLLASEAGTVFGSINKETLYNFPILLPPLPEQKAIADVLSSIDDKIELLHRQNKTLEEMAMTLFKQWFIEPTKDGLPEGWEEVSLGDSDLSKIIPSGIKKFEGFKTYLATGDVEGTLIKGGVEITYNNRPSRANMQPEKYSVWFAKKEGVRKLLMFDDYSNTDKYILSTGFTGLKTNELSHYYIWCFILSEDFQDIKDSLVSGSVQPDIPNEAVLQIFIPRPPNEVLLSFNEKVKPLFTKIQFNNSQIQTLEKLRDTLLPKLINGEIRVKI